MSELTQLQKEYWASEKKVWYIASEVSDFISEKLCLRLNDFSEYSRCIEAIENILGRYNMRELVQADGDFNLWADLVEGLDWLPEDCHPNSGPYPKRVLFVVQRSETEPEDYHPFSFAIKNPREVKKQRRWFESRGHPIILWTPPLWARTVERYRAAFLKDTNDNPWLTSTNEEMLRGVGWIN